jgi:hypothetical protein
MELANKTYLVRFKPPQLGVQLVAASSAEIQGDHIALLNSNGQLAALLLLDIVESWVVVKLPEPTRVERGRAAGLANSSEKVTRTSRRYKVDSQSQS